MLRQGSCYGDTSRVEEVGTSWLRLGDATAPGSRAGFSPTLETVHLGRTSAHLGTLKPLTAMENCRRGWKTTCTSVFVQIRHVSQIIPSRPPACHVSCDQNQFVCRHQQQHRQPAVARANDVGIGW